MTPERFSKLLAAYGADVERWPEGERGAARTLLARDPVELHAQLAEARHLDGWLDSGSIERPDAALEQRIIATGPVGHDLHAVRSPARQVRSRWVWPGAGLIGAGLAGSLTGALIVSVALQGVGAANHVEWPERDNAFGSAFTEWSDE